MIRSNVPNKCYIESRLRKTINSLLLFKVSFDIQLYSNVAEFNSDQQSEFEMLLHTDGYPISGTGIKFNHRALSVSHEDLYEHHLLNNEPLAPEDTTETSHLFPFNAASAAYCFSMMEVFGDFCSDVVTTNKRKRFSAWHKGIHADTNMTTESEKNKARSKYVELLGGNASQLEDKSILRLRELKTVRNAYTHELKTEVDFDKFFEHILLTVYQVAVISCPSINKVQLYPFYDHNGIFQS